VSGRSSDLLRFYERNRIDDQLKFYTSRRDQFDRAIGQGLALSAMLLGFASAAGALAGTALAWAQGWSAVAAILSAASTALAAYLALYAFEQQSQIYADAARAVRAASRLIPDRDATAGRPPPEESVRELVSRVEDALRQEQAQWGQLTSQIQAAGQRAAE
jgi:SMODS and SLOG-associating 2TM effector domain 1